MFGFALVHQFKLYAYGHGSRRKEVVTNCRAKADGLILVVGKAVVRVVQGLKIEAEFAREVQTFRSGQGGGGKEGARSENKRRCDGAAPQTGEKKGKIVHGTLPYDGHCGL